MRELVDALVQQDMVRANALLADYPGLDGKLTVERTKHPRPLAAAPVWRIEQDGTSRFRFHLSSWQSVPQLIFFRWATMLPLIAPIVAAGKPGRCWFSLGDEGHRPGLVFCGNSPDQIGVPDPYFMDSLGYAGLREIFARNDLSWQQRAPVAFWRGATTGPYSASLDELPRVIMSRLARSMGGRADVGLSQATEGFEDKIPQLSREGIWKDYVPIEALDRYQVHIDIDGHSNSWPGLLSKLHSGGAILKVESLHGFRQWYYDRLQAGTHYIPVRADLADLVEKAEFLLDNPGIAEQIGRAGQALAREMTYEAEIERIIPVVMNAFEPI
jgi:hypothetical protein